MSDYERFCAFDRDEGNVQPLPSWNNDYDYTPGVPSLQVDYKSHLSYTEKRSIIRWHFNEGISLARYIGGKILFKSLCFTSWLCYQVLRYRPPSLQ